jgi:O-antigen ligase
MSGIFFDELIAGWYIAFFFSLFLAFKGFSNNFFLILFYILNIFCLILTGEKTSLLSFIIILIFNLFFNKLSRNFFLKFFCFTVIIFFLAVFTNNNIYKRFILDPLKYINDPFYWTPNFRDNDEIILKKHDFEKKPILDKLQQTAWGSHYLIAYYMFVDKPFFGHGVRSFRIECSKYFYKDLKLQYFGCSTHPHNIFFELLAETGILNLLLFGTLNLFIFIKCTSIKYINKKNIFFATFAISIILSIIFPLKPSGSIFATNYASPYWMLLGMVISLIKKGRN